MTTVYVPLGGYNYSTPDGDVGLDDPDAFATLTEALDEWQARRNDWTGRWPLWGDGDGDVVVAITDGDTVDVWTLPGAYVELGRDLDELAHYLDPADIARSVLADGATSDHRQVIEAWRRLNGYEAPESLPGFPRGSSFEALDPYQARSVREQFPELDDLRWDGSWLDLDAMGVGPEWVDDLARELTDGGYFEWIDGELFEVGVHLLKAAQR